MYITPLAEGSLVQSGRTEYISAVYFYIISWPAGREPILVWERTLTHLLRIGDLQDSCALAEALACCLQRRKNSLLVLDDLHLLYDTSWPKPFLHRLMLLLPEETHLLIAVRSATYSAAAVSLKQQLRVIDESA
jgi:hypothetical protein